MFRTWCNRLFVFQIAPVCGANIFVLFFSTLVASRPNLFLITGLRVMIPGIALIVPIVSVIWERFHMITSKFYTIVAIVWMELNSISCPSIWVHLCGVSIIMIIPIVWTVFDTTVMIRMMWTIIWKPGLRKQSGVQVVYLSFVRQYWGKGVLYCVVKGNNVAFKTRSCIITVNCPSVWQLMLHPSPHPRLSQMKPLRSVKYCCSLYNIHFYWCVQTHWCNVFWCCNNSRMSLELKTTVR